MDSLFAAPPSRPHSNAWIAVSAAFHVTFVGAIVVTGARVASTPPRVSLHRSITFVNVTTAIAIPPAPAVTAAPRLRPVASPEEPRVSVAPEPAPLPPRPPEPPRVEARTPDPLPAVVDPPARSPEISPVAAVAP